MMARNRRERVKRLLAELTAIIFEEDQEAKETSEKQTPAARAQRMAALKHARLIKAENALAKAKAAFNGE